ncbi:MAG: hypothetical protein ACLR0U_04970 [Enterocloster clostridioformis]
MEGNLITLANGLVVSVDWLSFTVTSINDLVDVLDMLGYTTRGLYTDASGACGYRTMFRLNGYSLASFVMVTRIWVSMWTWPALL